MVSRSIRQPASCAAAVILCLATAACLGSRSQGAPDWKEWRSSGQPGRYEVFELSFQNNRSGGNPFFDVTVEAEFTSPAGQHRRIDGFYYSGTVWKIRFRPDVPGRWNYRYRFSAKDGFRHVGRGSFECLPTANPGPVRRNPANPFRWVFADGSPYYPVGLQDGFQAEGEELKKLQIDGEEREGPRRLVTAEEYFSIYGRAGFNLLRFSQKNSSYALLDDLDHFRVAESLATDRVLSEARRHGFRIMFGFFGFHGRWAEGGTRIARGLRRLLRAGLRRREEAINDPDDHETVAKEKRFMAYCVARWGVYADFWELLNERHAADAWTKEMASYVHFIDPGHKPVSTSWERPWLPGIDINAPHWYVTETELESDLNMREKALKWKAYGKPVLVGEQGNSGMNWDPTSARRMRIRAWTALFQEVGLIFWNTSWSKFGMHLGRYSPGKASNIYLGPEERGYIRVLQNFASQLDAEVVMTPVEVSLPERVRGYGLLSPARAAVYLHHFQNHTETVDRLCLTLQVPGNSAQNCIWIEPATGKVLARTRVDPGRQTLITPPFTVDLALLLGRGI